MKLLSRHIGAKKLILPLILVITGFGTIIYFYYRLSNELKLTVDMPEQKNAWLYYADSYHPNWQAWVDGIKTPVSKANLAFKAIPIQQGSHQVTFRFVSSFREGLIYLIAVIGILFCIAVLAQMFLMIAGFSKMPL